MQKRNHRLLAAALTGAALILPGFYTGLVTRRYAIPTGKLSRRVRIALVSDFHACGYGEKACRLTSAIHRGKPDLLVMTGDIFDRRQDRRNVEELLRGLEGRYPAYYVTGNHEWALPDVPGLKRKLEEAGVTVLSNETAVLARGGDEIVLAGIDDPNGYADQTTPEELYAKIQEENPGLFTALLAHRNDHFGQYANAGYDFILSGHGHGGIVRLPFMGGLVGTDRRLFPPWTAGMYTVGKSTLFVSRGLGNNTVPFRGFRLFNRPELAIVTLRKG